MYVYTHTYHTQVEAVICFLQGRKGAKYVQYGANAEDAR